MINMARMCCHHRGSQSSHALALFLLLVTSIALSSALVATSPNTPSSSSSSSLFNTIKTASVINPQTGKTSTPFDENNDDEEEGTKKKKSLVILLPQLGEFDSSEFCEQIIAVQDELTSNDITLKVIGIGETRAATEFCNFSGLSLDVLFVDPDASLHDALQLKRGPGWTLSDDISDGLLKFGLSTLPGGVPEDERLLRPTANAWLNYLAMCAGIGAPGTLKEILRGYFGDMSAPERFGSDDIVKAGFIEIGPGVGPVKIGPLTYSQWWGDEKGYQRPVELATVRLKNMVEVLTKWNTYVTNPTVIDRRGATYLFDENGKVLYEYQHKGVLTYSETMSRPLSFLTPYINKDKARNPLGFADTGGNADDNKSKRGRGILKPAGKAMGLLKPIFSYENKIQAQVLDVEDADAASARKEIEDAISQNDVVIYTYGLSPFSSEALGVLDEAGCSNYKKIELGLEWFLLGKEASAKRLELLKMTGQSSLPHVFIGGKHIGGLFTGTAEGGPGLAALKESGELQKMIEAASSREKESDE
mmetsp:Transcript_18488/g.27111  ORF Transcript_18488/g.27111 Transcript_18488/m.27111 type:complete len:533 (+) Transcript_18488:34-1632(+)